MPKVGFSKDTKDASMKARLVDSERVPGQAFNIEDPALRLINRIGGGFFNEPDYYDLNRTSGEFYAEIRKKGRIETAVTDEMGLTQVAREIIDDCEELAQSDNAEDLLMIANWIRNELNIRYTPAVLLAIASHFPESRQYVKTYAPYILTRADDPVNAFAFYRHAYQQYKGVHKGTLPNSLKKGIVRAFQKQSVYQLLKWNNSETRPNIRDVLIMVRNARVDGRNAVNRGIYEFIVNDKITEDAPEIIQLREKWNKVTELNDYTMQIAQKLGLTWENLISKFGSNKQTWEALVRRNMLPYMALLRNLRNLEQAKISEEAWNHVQVKFNETDPRSHKQLPMRYQAAYDAVSTNLARQIVSEEMDRAVANFADLPGRTLIMTDNSGSTITSVSGDSRMSCRDAGNLLMAYMAKRFGARATISVFGDRYQKVAFERNQSVKDIQRNINAAGKSIGDSTENGLWIGIDEATRNDEHYDRIILVSDLQCYTLGDVMGNFSGRYARGRTFVSRDTSVQGMINEYRRQVNSDVEVYSINLQQYRQTVTDPEDSQVHLMSGWSEKLINTIAAIEEGNAEQEQLSQTHEKSEPVKVTTLDTIRSRFKVSE